jgi:putative membrane protein
VAPGIITLITSFIYGAVWWIVAAGISATTGKIIDLIIERKPFRRHLAMPFLLISGGLVLWGASVFILSGNDALGIPPDSAFQYLLLSIFGAFLIAFVVIIPLTRKA